MEINAHNESTPYTLEDRDEVLSALIVVDMFGRLDQGERRRLKKSPSHRVDHDLLVHRLTASAFAYEGTQRVSLSQGDLELCVDALRWTVAPANKYMSESAGHQARYARVLGRLESGNLAGSSELSPG